MLGKRRERSESEGVLKSTTMNLDWEEELREFQNVMASGTKSLKMEAMAKLAGFSEHAPEHVLSHAIPILTEILGQHNPNDPALKSLQEAAAYCLKCIASRGDGELAIQMAAQGARIATTRLLPHSEGKMQEVLIKLLLVLVTFCKLTRTVVALNGGIETVIRLLNSPPVTETRQDLLEILSMLASLKDGRKALTRVGALHLIVEAAGTGSMVSRVRACKTIRILAVPKEAARKFVELGAVPVLVELLRDGDQTTKLTAALSLRELSFQVDWNTKPFAQSGAIPLFAELLQGPGRFGKETACSVLSELVVREDSAVEILGHMVRILREGDDESKASAANVVCHLFDSYNKNLSCAIWGSGAIPILIELLWSRSEEVMKNVSMIFTELSNDREDRMALAKAGAIPILMNLLHHENTEPRDNAAKAVFNFYEDPLHHARVSDATNVPSFRDMMKRLIDNRESNKHMTRMAVRRFITDESLCCKLPQRFC